MLSDLVGRGLPLWLPNGYTFMENNSKLYN